MSSWVDVCAEIDIEEEDLITWEYDGQLYAIYKLSNGFFATDGMCTHEEQSLDDGMVLDGVIECPLHGGRFDICTGKALSAPVFEDLRTYPVKNEHGRVLIKI